MPAAHHSVDIARPIEAVFNFLANGANNPRWQTGDPHRSQEEPVEFVEAFAQNYSEGGYITTRVRKQLTDAIGRAAGEDTENEGISR